MLYELIERALLEKKNIKKFWRNKYYDSLNYETMVENGVLYHIYNALEIFLEFIYGKYHLSLLITFYITDKDGNPVNKDTRKIMTNSKMSTVYNSQYNERLYAWNGLLRLSNTNIIEFRFSEFTLNFNLASITHGNINKPGNFPQRIAYQFDEPIMVFNINDKDAKGINQLRGYQGMALLISLIQQTMRNNAILLNWQLLPQIMIYQKY
jgi:hypothetical protein